MQNTYYRNELVSMVMDITPTVSLIGYARITVNAISVESYMNV